MLEFSQPLKIYLFKDRRDVDFAIRVSPNCTNTYHLTQEQFENIIQNWRQGIRVKTGQTGWNIEYKKVGPRPECEPASYVRITVWANGVTTNYRVDYTDMVNLEKDYFYQVNNKMYWEQQ
jgi:hypothetical protein